MTTESQQYVHTRNPFPALQCCTLKLETVKKIEESSDMHDDAATMESLYCEHSPDK